MLVYTQDMIIIEALNWGAQQLEETLFEKKTNRHRPKLDATLLLSEILNASRASLLANADNKVSEEDFEKYRRFIMRRKRHEPVSHIIGKVSFWKGEFFVNRHVLTPRPETEELIELIIKSDNGGKIVDIGTGSGAIAISLAKELKRSVLACDIDRMCLSVARKNSYLNGVENLVELIKSDLMPEGVMQDGERAMIIANLPYIPKRDAGIMDPDVILFEPHHALFSGHDGLNAIHKLLDKMRYKQNIDIWLEIDPSQVEFLSKERGVEFFDDMRGLTRFARIKK